MRGISRVSGLAYNTVVSIVRASSAKALLVHNDRVQQVTSSVVTTDEMWSFVQKTEAMSLRGIRSGRLLDWTEFSGFKWLDLGSTSGQAHGRVD